MNKKIISLFFNVLLIISFKASDDCFITINGQKIPIIAIEEGSSFDISAKLCEGVSIASPEFHRNYIIPFQKILGHFHGPIVCFLTSDHKSRIFELAPLPVYAIAIPKNEKNEGCIASLLHEFGHLLINYLWNNTIKSGSFGLSTDSEIINYPLKMHNNFKGLGVCGILSALIFAIMPQPSPSAYMLPILYGTYCIIRDIPNTRYYNHCRRLEEQVCDIFMINALANAIRKVDLQTERNFFNIEPNTLLDQFIVSLCKANQKESLSLKFLHFLTGKSSLSSRTRMESLMTMKNMKPKDIEKLLDKKIEELIDSYQSLNSLSMFS